MLTTGVAPLLVSTAQTLDVVAPHTALESTMSTGQLLKVLSAKAGLVLVPIKIGFGMPLASKFVERVIPGGRLLELKTVFRVLTVPN